MTMLEHIARAILKARFYDCEPHMYGDSVEGFFASIDQEHMDDALVEARAALEAMREPTDPILESAHQPIYEWKNVAADEAYPLARNVWRSLVDAIMKEAKT